MDEQRTDRAMSLLADAISSNEELLKELFPDIDTSIERNRRFIKALQSVSSKAKAEAYAEVLEIAAELRKEQDFNTSPDNWDSGYKYGWYNFADELKDRIEALQDGKES